MSLAHSGQSQASCSQLGRVPLLPAPTPGRSGPQSLGPVPPAQGQLLGRPRVPHAEQPPGTSGERAAFGVGGSRSSSPAPAPKAVVHLTTSCLTCLGGVSRAPPFQNGGEMHLLGNEPFSSGQGARVPRLRSQSIFSTSDGHPEPSGRPSPPTSADRPSLDSSHK